MQKQVQNQFDVAVLGLGAMGVFALENAARRGLRCVGIDQFVPPHDHGSSHGETRLIREAYSEDPAYIPLLQRSLELWRRFSAADPQPMFFETGVEYLGPADNPSVLATRQSARQYQIPLLEHRDINSPFTVPQGWAHFRETRAGYLCVESALSSVLTLAQEQGAKTLTASPIKSVEFERGAWRVILQDEVIQAKRLVFALGPWARELLPFLEPHLHLERRTVHWLSADTEVYGLEAGFKPFVVYAPNDKWFYGFPANAQGLVKVAEHYTPQPFADWASLDRTITATDREPIEQFRSQFLPTLGPIQASSSCVYTMSTDENFIIDRHPDSPTAVLVAGLSGHGYKFAPAIGEALIDMSLEQTPQRDLSFFALSRFGS